MKNKYIVGLTAIVTLLTGIFGLADQIQGVTNKVSIYLKKNNNINTSISKKNESTIKILFLPFYDISKEKNQDISYILKQNVDKLCDNSDLDIISNYLHVNNLQDLNSDSIKGLLKNNNADLIIYGDYIYDHDQYIINCKFQTSNNLCDVTKNFNSDMTINLSHISKVNSCEIRGNIQACLYAIMGFMEYKKLNYKNAVSYFEKSLALYPNNPSIYNVFADIYVDSGKYNKALDYYNKALFIDPQNFQSYIGRSYIYMNINKNDFAFKDVTKAIKNINYNDSKEYKHNLSFSYFIRALINYTIGDMTNALSDCNKSLSIEKDTSTYSLRAHIFRIKGNYKDAISDLNCILEIDNKKGNIYNFRGLTFIDCKNYKAAIDDFNKALFFNPQNSEIYFSRGVAYYNNKELYNAIDDFTSYIDFNENKSKGYYRRAICYLTKPYLTKSDIDNAFFDIQIAHNLSPTDSSINLIYSRALNFENIYKYDGQLKFQAFFKQ